MPLDSIPRNFLPITCLILTKNEERAIANCIKSVFFCSQIIVVDSESSDQTVILAKNLGAEVVEFKWNRKYPKKKQWSLQLSIIKNEWVMFLDADERISPELAQEIISIFASKEHSESAYEVPISYYFDGRLLRFGHKVKKRILINKNRNFFPIIDDLDVHTMWEVEGHYQPISEGSIGKLRNVVFHADPDPLYDYFARHNRYSDWEAHMRVNSLNRNSVRKSKTCQGNFFDLLPGKPLIFFFYSFFLRFGFLDGRAGFNYSLALAYYYWQISLKSREIRNVS